MGWELKSYRGSYLFDISLDKRKFNFDEERHFPGNDDGLNRGKTLEFPQMLPCNAPILQYCRLRHDFLHAM